MKNLGTLNALPSCPPEVTACIKAGHETETIKLARCWYEHTCHICNITWGVDSSD